MKEWLFGFALATWLLISGAAPQVGDTQGAVAAVRARPQNGTTKSFEIWFSQVQNNRWGCLNAGYVVIYENGIGVTPDSYKQMFAIALLAQVTGKQLGLDSASVDPCSNVNAAWVVG